MVGFVCGEVVSIFSHVPVSFPSSPNKPLPGLARRNSNRESLRSARPLNLSFEMPFQEKLKQMFLNKRPL